jgi:hypothetical protein
MFGLLTFEPYLCGTKIILTMRTASFQNDFNKVFSRSKSVISRKRFKILEEDSEKGIISAERLASFIKPSYSMKVNIIKNDENSTKVIVNIIPKKSWIKPRKGKTEIMEGRFISMLSGHL